jgi:Dolichyl-phosphate-mannose-protein mannosyltransferase
MMRPVEPGRRVRLALPGREAWIVLGLIALSVGLPTIAGITSGAISIPRNDDFSYRHPAMTLYESGRIEMIGWGVMTLVGQLLATLPLLWVSQGSTWAFAATTAIFTVVGVVAAYHLARRVLSPALAGLAVLLTICIPGFMLYTTAYMTDVPAFAMEMACLATGAAAIERTPEGHRWRWLTASLVIGCYAFSIRDFAIAAPIAVLIAAAASDRRSARIPYVVASMVVVISCVTIYRSTGDLPGQGTPAFLPPTLASIRKVLDAFTVLGLALAPAILVGVPGWVIGWRRTGRGRAAGFGALAGLVVATACFVDPSALFGHQPADVLHVLRGNVFLSTGSLDSAVFAGSRPALYPGVVWGALEVLALVGTFVAFALFGAWAVAERDRLRRAFDLRHRPTALGSVPGMLVVFVVVFAAGTVAIGAITNVFDRYAWPLALPLAVLLLARSDRSSRSGSVGVTDRAVRRSARLGAGLSVGVGLLLAVVASASLVLLLDADAFDGARWRMGEEAVRLGFAAETVDAGLEWVGAHSTGISEPLATPVPSMTRWAVRFPSFHQCAVASSSPLPWPGLTLVLKRTDAYRTLLAVGRPHAMYLYRVDDAGCPA